MEKKRRVLLLPDPVLKDSPFPQKHIQARTPVFDENGRYLSRAQEALQLLRREADWVCAAASGASIGVALALAAQLPVERLALWMAGELPARPRELMRIEAYARRNLSLVISEILLIGASEMQARRLARGLGRTDGLRCVSPGEFALRDLTAPWQGKL